MRTTHLTRTLLILFTVSFAACLNSTDPPKEPNVFNLSITIPDAGQDLFVGNDTLTVIGYKMLIDSISVKKQGQEDEKFEPKLRLASWTIGAADYYVVGTGSVGAGKFNGVGYWVVKPSLQNTTVNDEDLLQRDASSGTVIDTYSICITGVYDRKFFRFQSKVSRAVLYGFSDNVQLPDFNAYLEARLRGNWKQWFLNQAGNKILDPANPSNRTQIEENVLKYFDIFTISVGEVQ